MPQDALSTDPTSTLSRPAYSTTGYTQSGDGTRLHYYTVGEGDPALVCCDGLGCDGYIWKYVTQEFAGDHRVVRWHYRGHGRSEAPRDRSRMRITDLADDLAAMMDHHGLEDAVLLGHSLGVQVLLEFHRRYPERVRGLVLACGSYGRPVDTFNDGAAFKHVFPVLHSLVKRFPSAANRLWRKLDSDLTFQIGMKTGVNARLMRPEDFRDYFTHLANMDVELFFDLLADAAEHDLLLHLGDIDVPTLIVAGERDTFTPYWLSAVMHARIPRSELLSVPTATHTAPIEMPELVTLRLRRFLEQSVAAPA